MKTESGTESQPATTHSPARSDRLRLGFPSRGRIEEPALEFFASCGLRISRENPRQYGARIRRLPGVEVVLQRARDIVHLVAAGNLDIGLTGLDLYTEYGREGDPVVVVCEDLGFNEADLILAVPESWVDVTSVSDVADVAIAMREQGRELRVATEFPNLSRRFLYERGITYFSLVQSEGATEAAPNVGLADLIAGLTATGTTLRENHLKPITGGVILHTQACLIGNRQLLAASEGKREQLRQLLELIEGRLRAQDFFSVTANMKAASQEDVAERLLRFPATRGLRGPTVARVLTAEGERDHWFAATILVRANQLVAAVDALRAGGGSSISVTEVRYIFEERSRSYSELLRELRVRAIG